MLNVNSPVYEKLLKYHDKNAVSFAMPGHKNGRGLAKGLIDCDVTELPRTSDLNNGSPDISAAEILLASLYGSDKSFIVTDGSTTSLHAAISGVLRPGETLLASSDCHMSVINTCALCGFNLRIAKKDINNDFLIPESFADIRDIIEQYDDIRAVLVTSPTPYGICAPIRQIAEICHKRGIVLIADEAHGAHFVASKRFPPAALAEGADISVQSAHKTLNALTGASFLHLKSTFVDYGRIAAALNAFRSSSPSYVIAASADFARAELESGTGWDKIIDICDSFKNKILSKTHIKILENDDPTRIVLNFSAYNTTGLEVEKRLFSNHNTDIEMSDLRNIVLIITAANTEDDLDKLAASLCKICGSLSPADSKKFSVPSFPACDGLISPAAAFYGTSETIPLTDSEGRISSRCISVYPPCTPVIIPGEKISAAKIKYIGSMSAAGAKINGLTDGKAAVIRIGR